MLTGPVYARPDVLATGAGRVASAEWSRLAAEGVRRGGGGCVGGHVYGIELRPDVMEKKAFAEKNADRREDKPCVYVGQTARTPEERFAQHLAGIRSSRIVKVYGVRLRPRPRTLMFARFESRAESERAETKLAEKLRRRGYAVWSN